MKKAKGVKGSRGQGVKNIYPRTLEPSNPRYLLAIDIGNTNVVGGVFQGRKFLKEIRIPTRHCTSVSGCKKVLQELLDKTKEIRGAILCSVVPALNRFFKKAAISLGVQMEVVGETVRCPIPNRYRKPKEVGQDRLVNAYAALKRYGAPILIVDFGTAITVDLVSRKGEYLGGIIAPGMGISLEALKEKTALLPRVRLHPPSSLLGKDTRGSMLSGTFHGFSSLCDGLISKLRMRYGSRIKAVATGGHSAIITSYCKKINYVDKRLTVEGLSLIFEKYHP